MPDDVAQRFVNRQRDAPALVILKAPGGGQPRNCVPHYSQKARIAGQSHLELQWSARGRIHT